MTRHSEQVYRALETAQRRLADADSADDLHDVMDELMQALIDTHQVSKRRGHVSSDTLDLVESLSDLCLALLDRQHDARQQLRALIAATLAERTPPQHQPV